MTNEQLKIMVDIWEKKKAIIIGIVYVLYIVEKDGTISFCAKPYTRGQVYEQNGNTICLN